jgi:hypothetical protein
VTRIQATMLRKANACSLPGDGLRIKGAGQRRTAQALQTMGYVSITPWVLGPGVSLPACVHITLAGRTRLGTLPELS